MFNILLGIYHLLGYVILSIFLNIFKSCDKFIYIIINMYIVIIFFNIYRNKNNFIHFSIVIVYYKYSHNNIIIMFFVKHMLITHFFQNVISPEKAPYPKKENLKKCRMKLIYHN